ncbi:MAG TPA: protein kinase [Streptosporangiaceae bacterium]|nr:protein kinase [Streptosporangiaceae bacterium]
MPATEHLPRALGPYRLQDRLGEGGMGVVHLAQDPEGRPVAVKVLRALGGTEGANARRRLAREVETMRRVRSPYVAEVLDADVTGEYPYIVTRFVPGPTLDEMVRERGPLSGPGLRRLAHGIAEALTAIHAAGVVHRDLKPGNVMLTDDRPIVIDFGIAQAGDATRLTQTGLVMGTPGYLAPEVIEGEPSSSASDVHSWGSTMTFAATGRLPFGGGSYETIFYRIVSGRADLTGVPAPLVPLISAALARDPSHRPSASWLSAHASALDMSAAAIASYAPTSTYAGPPLPGSPLAGSPLAGSPLPGAPVRQPTFTPTAAAGSAPAEAARAGSALPGAALPGASLPPSAFRPPIPPPAAPQPAAPRAASQRAAAAPLAPKQAARDVADLLPPVEDTPRPAASPGAPGPWGPRGPRPAVPGPRDQRDPRDPAGPRDQRPPSRPNTAAGLAFMVAAIALTVVLPVAGLIAALAVITLLRAADRAQSRLAVRRSVYGPRASDLVVVLISAPLTVARALLTEIFMAPLALVAGTAAYGLAVVFTHSMNMPRAGACAAAAVVAWYGIGPGSGRPRRQLNRMAGAVARTPASAAAVAIVVWGVAAAAVLFAWSQPPYYWPATEPHLPWHWPGLHNVIMSASHWLLAHIRL